jgi:hypothetical protein
MPLIQCPACANNVSVAAAACPRCGHPVSPGPSLSAAPQAFSDNSPGLRGKNLAAAIAGGILVLLLVVWWASTTSLSRMTTSVASPPSAAAPAPQGAAVDPTTASLAKMDTMSCSDAFVFAKPYMSDSTEEVSPGAALFALWAARRMRWADVHVPADETTFAMVRKSSAEQLGKRMCSAGQIVEIYAEKPESGGHVAKGMLLSDAGHLYRFVAAGSSGTIVQGSYANLCGFVTGNFDYSNSAGGTGHAVAIVGMFDLPENAKPGR